MALPQEGIAAAGIAAAEQRLAELGRCWREEAIRAGLEAEVAEQVGSCVMDGISYRSVRGKRSCCPSCTRAVPHAIHVSSTCTVHWLDYARSLNSTTWVSLSLQLQAAGCPTPSQLHEQLAAALRRTEVLADRAAAGTSFAAHMRSLAGRLDRVGLASLRQAAGRHPFGQGQPERNWR